MAKSTIRAPIGLFTSDEAKASGNICTMASPIKAPHPKAKRNLIKTSKNVSEQHLFSPTTMRAATNPMRETANPPKNPNPQICGTVKLVVAWSSWSSWSSWSWSSYAMAQNASSKTKNKNDSFITFLINKLQT